MNGNCELKYKYRNFDIKAMIQQPDNQIREER